MPPKKRKARNAHTAGQSKRQKPNAPPPQTDATAPVDLTALNAVASPLLRLPTELRHQIWELAYGDKMVLVYTASTSEDGDDQIQVSYMAYGTVTSGDCMTGEAAFQCYTTPQFASRQFWAEASEVYLASCTFRFNHPDDFRRLALSGRDIVTRIRRLMIHLSGGKTHNFPMYSHGSFTSSIVGRFSSLEGLIFAGSVYWGPREAVVDSDVLGGYHWKMIHMPVIIRAFQQHKLKEELTHVTMRAESEQHDVWEAEPYNEAIRKALLEYQPRRLSKRRQ